MAIPHLRTDTISFSFYPQNEMLPEDVEGCDIASPFRDFMAESLREPNEKVKIEMAKTMKALLGKRQA